MEISLIVDTAAASATQGLGFAKSMLLRHDFASSSHLSLCESSSEQPSAAGILQVSALLFPVDAVAPPPVKSSYLKTATRTLLRNRKARRIRRRSGADGGDEDGEEGGFYSDGGDGGGPFGGSGGRGWNFDRFGWSNWDESSSASPSDPAFDFVYEVISWIALSNCLHFALKKVLRLVTDGMDDPAREKVRMRLTAVC
ncbi:hypothetical protein NMG60_11025047 [Bertholletia excelsa]